MTRDEPSVSEVFSPDKVVTILTIAGSDVDADSVRSILNHSNWRVYEAHGQEEALQILGARTVAVVICEANLPDGDWRTFLDRLTGMAEPPLLIVTSEQADERLWAEVLNLGAYDLIPRPFDQKEVIRIVSAAWLHWKGMRAELRRMGPASEQNTAKPEPYRFAAHF